MKALECVNSSAPFVIVIAQLSLWSIISRKQKIATAIMKQKEKEKSRGDSESDPSLEVEGRNIFMEFALDRINNHTLGERFALFGSILK